MSKVYLQEKLTAGDNITIDSTNKISAGVPEILEATQSAAGLMPASDKKKLDGITLSNDLTETGANVVPANIIYKAIDKKQDKLTFDTSPTSGSNNPVTSGGVYTMKNNLDTAIGKKQDKLTFDSTPTSGSSSPVTSEGIRSAIDAIPTGMSKHLITSIAIKSTGGSWSYGFTLSRDILKKSYALLFESDGALGSSSEGYVYIASANVSNASYRINLAPSKNKYPIKSPVFIVGGEQSKSISWTNYYTYQSWSPYSDSTSISTQLLFERMEIIGYGADQSTLKIYAIY